MSRQIEKITKGSDYLALCRIYEPTDIEWELRVIAAMAALIDDGQCYARLRDDDVIELVLTPKGRIRARHQAAH